MDSCSAKFSGQCYRLILSIYVYRVCWLAQNKIHSSVCCPNPGINNSSNSKQFDILFCRQTDGDEKTIERSGSPTIIAIQNLLAQRKVATSSISQYNGGTPNITSLRHDFTRYDPEKQLVQISTYNFSIQERSLYTGFSLDTRPKSLLVFIVSQDYAVNF